MLSDLKYAFRQLAKSPSHAIIIVLATALAIGACTVVFSIVNTIVLHPLNGVHSDRVVLIRPKGYAGVGSVFSDGRHFDAWMAHATSFEALCGVAGSFAMSSTGGEAFRIGIQEVRGQLLDVSGIKPIRGRGFLPEEFTAGRNRVALIKERLWRKAFPDGSDPIGQTLQINDEPYTIIGVLPATADADTFSASQIDAWTPLVPAATQDPNRPLLIGAEARLKPGVPMAAAQAEINRLAAAVTPEQSHNANFGYVVLNKAKFISSKSGPMLWSLLGAVGCVLLIACANIANLLLARATARQHEVALRAALGAGRGRLVRLFMIESLVLASFGGILGLAISAGAINLVRASGVAKVQQIGEVGTGLYRLPQVQLDWPVLGFAFAATLIAGLLCGAAPALLGSRINLVAAMKESSRGSTEGRGVGRWRGIFVVAETALAVVLLIGAGVFLRSFLAATAIDPGFEPSQAIAFNYMIPPKQYTTPEACVAFGQRLIERLHELPNVQAVGTGNVFAISPYPASQPYSVEGRPKPESERARAMILGASPEYFSAVGVPLLQGRTFVPSDSRITGMPGVVIVNATLARHCFPNENPVGKRLVVSSRANAPTQEIIGVVGDVRQSGPESAIADQIYFPFATTGTKHKVIVRGQGDLAALFAAIQAQARKVEPGLVIVDVAPLQAQLDNLLAQRRFTAQLLTLFSGLALLIAVVGIYAVVAYNVARRTSEIGIRMALGAQGSDVLRMVLSQGVRLVGAGLLVGLGIAFAASWLIEAMLFETSARDPLSFIAVPVVIAAVALLACWIPARRATRVDPVEALRAE
ncbi:MAG TPA: ABC transporter permease [Opitutaceae bacterium]|nr:ABC transporter permease [Opitutaceae bacterium]